MPSGSKPKPNSLRQRVLRFVNSRPRTTTQDVVRALAHTIPANQAITAGRRKEREWDKKRVSKKGKAPVRSLEQLALIGRRVCLIEAASDLISDGKIRRLERGVYAPLEPRLLPESVTPEPPKEDATKTA